MNLAFPKPCQIKKTPEVEHTFRDGRTKINQNTKAGRDLYQERKRIAWEEQKRLCGICHQPLRWTDSTVDHKNPRGMGAGKIDDRQSNLQAVHGICNTLKGSRRIAYYDAP